MADVGSIKSLPAQVNRGYEAIPGVRVDDSCSLDVLPALDVPHCRPELFQVRVDDDLAEMARAFREEDRKGVNRAKAVHTPRISHSISCGCHFSLGKFVRRVRFPPRVFNPASTHLRRRSRVYSDR